MPCSIIFSHHFLSKELDVTCFSFSIMDPTLFIRFTRSHTHTHTSTPIQQSHLATALRLMEKAEKKKANNNHLFTVTKRRWSRREKWTLLRQTLLVIEGMREGEGQFNRNAPKCKESEPGHILGSERQRLHIRSPTAESGKMRS